MQDGEIDEPGNGCADAEFSKAQGSKHSSGFPQAGTLVVAPTSLLKQWQSEIETKVCFQGSFLCFTQLNHDLVTRT
jgi:hypothetical protein